MYEKSRCLRRCRAHARMDARPPLDTRPTHAIDLRAYIQHLNAQEMALARRLAVFYISSPLE